MHYWRGGGGGGRGGGGPALPKKVIICLGKLITFSCSLEFIYALDLLLSLIVFN